MLSDMLSARLPVSGHDLNPETVEDIEAIEGPTEKDFLVSAHDSRGHTKRGWFTGQPGYFRQMEIILQSRLFPYRTTGDFVRHAIARHIAWLETLAPFPSIRVQLALIDEVLADEMFHAEFVEVIDRIEARVTSYLTVGQTSRAEQLVRRIIGRIEEMPPGEWQERYRAEMYSRFSKLLGG